MRGVRPSSGSGRQEGVGLGVSAGRGPSPRVRLEVYRSEVRGMVSVTSL